LKDYTLGAYIIQMLYILYIFQIAWRCK